MIKNKSLFLAMSCLSVFVSFGLYFSEAEARGNRYCCVDVNNMCAGNSESSSCGYGSSGSQPTAYPIGSKECQEFCGAKH